MSRFKLLPRSSSKPTCFGTPNNSGTTKHVGIFCMPCRLSAVSAANQLHVKGLDEAGLLSDVGDTRSHPQAANAAGRCQSNGRGMAAHCQDSM